MRRLQPTSNEPPGRAGPDGPSGLTLLLGPANSGKLGYVLDWWAERLALRPVLVVPNGPSAHDLTAEMVRRAGALVDLLPALTFDDLVSTILRRVPRHSTEFERTLIMNRLLQGVPLRSFGRIACLPGTAATLEALLSQLAEGGRDGDQIDGVLRAWRVADPRSADLADDLRRLYASYVDLTRRWGFTEGPVAAVAAAQEASRGAWSSPVALYGFTSFTPGQRGLIESVSSTVEVLITLAHERSRPFNLTAEAEVSFWQTHATETIRPAPQARAYSAPAIAYLERHLLSDEPPSPAVPASSPLDGVCFLLASGQRNEAELAAQQISALLCEGFRPGDIAVIVRRMEGWSGLLAQVFESCEIPYRIDHRRSLAESGLGNAFLSAMKGVARDDGDALLRFIRSPYSGLDPEAAGDLELSYRRGGARGAHALVRIAEQGNVGILADLHGMIVVEGGRSRLDLAAVEAVLRRTLVAGLRNGVVGGREQEEDARAFNALSEALLSMRRTQEVEDPEDRWQPESALGVLAKVKMWSDPPGSRDVVQVLSVQRARARRFDVVLILGLVEGEFPGRPDRPSVLTAQQRARIDSLAGGGFLAPQMDNEGALFLNAVSRARRVLFLSARDADDGGGEAVPSHLWQLSKELLGVSASDHKARSLGDVVFDPESAPSLRHYLRACAAKGCIPHRAVAPDRSTAIPVRPTRRRPTRLTDTEVIAELHEIRSFTSSSLEAYLACPFAWFIERCVGINELDPELDGRRTGKVLHEALSATYRSLRDAKALPLTPDRVRGAEETCFGMIDDLLGDERCPGSTAAKRVARWRLKRWAGDLLRMESGEECSLAVSETEWRLGGTEGVDIEGLRLRGRLDRVDSSPDGRLLFVIDYKSGAAPTSSSIGTERWLQLILYLLALAAERPDSEVIGGAYLSISEARMSGLVLAGHEGVVGSRASYCRVLDPAGARELFHRARTVAQEAADGIRTGVITPRDDRECPSWCSLGPACRSRAARYRP